LIEWAHDLRWHLIDLNVKYWRFYLLYISVAGWVSERGLHCAKQQIIELSRGTSKEEKHDDQKFPTSD